MPDHFHLLITPSIALERAVQLIKGGFSYQAKKEFGSNAEIWQRGFSDHRIRDCEDYDRHVHYVHLNPVKRRLCTTPAEYKYSSAYPGWKLDPIPQGLKPTASGASYGTAEAVPFQNMDMGLKPTGGEAGCGTAEAVPFQNATTGLKPAVFEGASCGTTEVVPFQSKGRGLTPVITEVACATTEVMPFQNTSSLHDISKSGN